MTTSTNKIIETNTPPPARVCRECGKEFAPDEVCAVIAKWATVCPTCSENHIRQENARDALEAGNRRLRVWENLCPPDFAATDPKRLPRPEMLARVLQWKFGRRGLLLHGPTGKGKSRCAWLLLKREFDAGRRIRVIDHSVGFRYAETFAQSAASAAVWIDQQSEAEILFLDDVFKARLTDSLEQALFTVISTRTEQGSPNIVSTNDTGDSLAGRLSPDRGQALIRRLVEYSTAIAFV